MKKRRDRIRINEINIKQTETDLTNKKCEVKKLTIAIGSNKCRSE